MTAPPVPESLKRNPRLGQWLGVGVDGRIRAYSGKVDIGQGISHALRLIVADELRVAPAQVEMVRASTATSPDEAVTSGSLSIQHSGAALRFAAAHLRELCRRRCAQSCDAQPEAVRLENGTFSVDGTEFQAGYLHLVDDAMLAASVDPSCLLPRRAKHAARGDMPRPDIEQKVFGQFEYINDMVLPDMCVGQVFRPKTLDAQVDESSAQRLQQELARLPGVVEVVRDGVLLGVLAESEHVLAHAGKKVLAAELWRGAAQVPGANGISEWLKSQPLDTSVVLDQRREAATQPARIFRAEFERPYLQHASLGLSCAIAQWTEGALRAWSHSQGIFNLRRDLALAFGLPADL